MLIVYRTETGEVVDNTGTSDAWPEGPPDEQAYVNTDRRGIDRAELSLLRLHDIEDAATVAQVLTHEVTVADGQVVVGDAHPEPGPPEPSEVDTLRAEVEDLQAEVRGIRDRAAAVSDPDAAKVRDAVAGPRT